jgi:hypothetical protein
VSFLWKALEFRTPPPTNHRGARLTLIQTLAEAAKPWADFYAKSKPTSLGVTYLHIAGVMIGGGFAMASDRAALRVGKGSAENRAFVLREFTFVHRPVIIALSGAAMLLADVETFLGNPVYYVKMGMFAALLVNGLLMQRNERRLAADMSESNSAWGGFRGNAIASIVLWLSIALAGVLLTSS